MIVCNRNYFLRWLIVTCLLTFIATVLAAEEAKISAATQSAPRWLMHEVESEYQAGKTKLFVQLPAELPQSQRFPVLYVLPVEEAEGTRWGNPRELLHELDIANRLQVICVYPTFTHLPWFCDHATDPKIRQESYLLKVVLPFIEKTYPAQPERKGRLLIGFSKSGYGAWSLLLRHPETFERAVAWDAPLMMEQPNQFGMGPIYGTNEHFQQYSLTKRVVAQAKELQAEPPRLIHIGYGNFREHHERMEKLLVEAKIPHRYLPGPQRKHAWDSGWLGPAAEWVVTGKEPK